MTDHRQEIYEAISDMLDNEDRYGIYPTTKCYDRLEAYCNSISVQTKQPEIPHDRGSNQYANPDDSRLNHVTRGDVRLDLCCHFQSLLSPDDRRKYEPFWESPW